MDRLEQYIKDNRNSFDTEILPSGSRERFMARLETEKKARRLRPVWLSVPISAAAAVAAVALSLSYFRVDREIERSISAMNSQEAQVIALVEEICPEEMDAVMNSIRSITAEAIPFTDQLPDELPERERVMIIKEYYSRKTEALQNLMTCYNVSMK